MPNTKTKKFDWQIFLAVSCILLVICCATICCVIGNTEKGVANAYTDEEVGVSNLDFTVNEGFYIRNFSTYEGADVIEEFINYFTYFLPNVMVPSQEISSIDFQVGSLFMRYLRSNSSVPLVYRFNINLSVEQDADNNIISLVFRIVGDADEPVIVYFSYDFVNKIFDDFSLGIFADESTSYPHNYFASITDNLQTSGTFAYQLIMSAFGSTDDIASIRSLEFISFVTSNLGCLVSPNETFANPPAVMPVSVYNNSLQNHFAEGYAEGFDEGHYEGYVEGHTSGYESGVASQQQTIEDLQNQINLNNALIEELRNDLAYYESLGLNMSLIDVFNPARMKSSTFVYDSVTYTSNSIVSTDDGWDVYSSTYYNEELPPNYGVGFSLFLPQSITNTKFYVYGDITGWYNYTYCSEPDEQGNQQCYQVSEQNTNISVGYRNQNGNIVMVGTFTSNLPGSGGVDFFIDSPTNEIVFFVENCNLMEVNRDVQVIYYYFDTESIYNDGYENGKSQGIKIGREEGYYEGVADANDYSFFSLFTSVFDAPITAIVGKWGDSDGDGVYQREGGMLNFYIPGLDINFAPFLLSLFTIAIIILVIRFVMARKS